MSFTRIAIPLPILSPELGRGIGEITSIGIMEYWNDGIMGF